MKEELDSIEYDNNVLNIKGSNKDEKLPARICNICEEEFIPKTKFDRFCRSCKEHSERYHFAEWLNSSSF
jgi:hypothetical protein